MPKKLAGLLAVAVFSLSCVHAQTEKRHTDRIFVNGKIWTADDAQPLARALAISGDRIVAVGSDEEVRAMAAPDTAVLDLRGHLVVPGFQDSHLHFPGRSVNEVDLHGVETLEDFQQRLPALDYRAWMGLLGFPKPNRRQEIHRRGDPRPPCIRARTGRPHGIRKFQGARDCRRYEGYT